MKRLLYCLNIIALFTACLSNSQKEEQSEVEQISEHKKSFAQIREERYQVPKENPDTSILSAYIVRKYDSLGLEKQSTYFNYQDQISMRFVNTFKGDQKVRVDWINASGVTVRYIKMQYDTNGRLAQSEAYRPSDDSFHSGFIHRWNADGSIEEKGPLIKGQAFKPNSIYTYNELEDVIGLVEYDENDSLYGTFQWNYTKLDEQKEWTERQMIFDDTLVRIEKRIIEYR